jgi:uncharacterized peroxidase-related enzyme
VTLDATLVRQLADDYTKAPLDARDRAMLDFAVKLTRDAVLVTKRDHDALRTAGFDELGILQITLIASFFNYVNRVADALGVGRHEDGSDKPLRG